MKGVEPPSFQLNIGDELDLENVFAVFKKVQMLTDTAKAVELATYLTIKEFFADGVKYLELRSTPRGKWYVEAVLAGMQKAMDHIQIVVRYLPSIDRARNLEHVQLILGNWLIIRIHVKTVSYIVLYRNLYEITYP